MDPLGHIRNPHPLDDTGQFINNQNTCKEMTVHKMNTYTQTNKVQI